MENLNATTSSNEDIAKKKYDNSEDPALLLVKGASIPKEKTKDYVKGLASAICTVYQKYHVIRLRCVGKGAVGNGVAALAIANLELEKQNIKLINVPVHRSVSFGEEKLTAIVLEAVGISVDVWNTEIESSKAPIEEEIARQAESKNKQN